MKRIIVSSLSMIFVSTALLASSSNPLDSATGDTDPCNDGKQASAPAQSDASANQSSTKNPTVLVDTTGKSSPKK